MRKMLFSDLSMHVQTVFANLCEDGVTPEENYEGFKKLTYDLNHNPNEIYDEEGNKISKKEFTYYKNEITEENINNTKY